MKKIIALVLTAFTALSQINAKTVAFQTEKDRKSVV